MRTIKNYKNAIIRRIIRSYKNLFIKIYGKQDLMYKYKGLKLLLNLKKDVDFLIYFDSFESKNLKLYQTMIKSGNIVFDVGANIGIYSLLASKSLGKDGQIYSFEPSETAFERLNINVNLNNFKNIITIKEGVSDITGECSFYVCEDDAYNSIGSQPMKSPLRSITIPTTTIDDFVIKHNIKNVNIIKVDTEGAEYLVFKGAINTLENFKPIIFFEYNPFTANGYNHTKTASFELLENYGYLFYEFHNEEIIKVNGFEFKTYDIIAIHNNSNINFSKLNDYQ